MDTKKQLRFIASNLLSEVEDALKDVREGVVPQIQRDAFHMVEEVTAGADEFLGRAQALVVDLKARVRQNTN